MSKQNLHLFGKLPTLSTCSWTVEKLKSWKWSDRHMEPVMQRFIDLNRKNLDFMGISARIETLDGKPTLQLTTSKFIGAIPLLSPMNGKVAGDLIVTGRFGENAGEIISLLDNTIRPEYSAEFRLALDSQMTPPIFIECCKYIDKYLEAEKYKWRKFTNVVKQQHQPSSSTLWGEYAQRTAKNPLEFNTFNNKCNTLTCDHEEWRQLAYVLTIAINELSSHNVPVKVRMAFSDKINTLRIKLRDSKISETDNIKERMSDPLVIKQLKTLGNKILKNKSGENLAWRMDYAKFFERYVQYLFADVAKKKGANAINNSHYGIRTFNKPSWVLNYLEPDLVLSKASEQYVIDAKYKSHIFNWNDSNDELKETFRHDLQQVLAYCSFNSMVNKQAILAYPFSEFAVHKMKAKSPITNSENTIQLVGIPIDKCRIEDVKEKLSSIIVFDD